MPRHRRIDVQAQQKWNARYTDTTSMPAAARVLLENQHLLPARGQALDLACGLGGNALLLARHGLDTWAWDIADVALTQLQDSARQLATLLHTEVRDVTAYPPPVDSFDVIVVSRFLDRSLVPHLIQALRPAGLLFYQTFTYSAVMTTGPTNPAYRLAPQELLRLLQSLHILVYREEGQVGDLSQGWRDEALLVGRKDSK